MKQVKIFGSGCPRCVKTAEIVKAEAEKLGIDIVIEKVTDHADIAKAGIMSTPGVMIDGKLVHSGGVPEPAAAAKWFQA